MTAIQKFITEHNLSMSCKHADSNPNMDDADWSRSARHYLCRIIRNSGDWLAGSDHGTIEIYFSQGSAHTKEPSLSDVLECLASDAATVENAQDFEDWANELGYDTDSRKAEASYEACLEQSDNLKELLGDAYEALLWNIEEAA